LFEVFAGPLKRKSRMNPSQRNQQPFAGLFTMDHKARVEVALFQHLIDNSVIPLIGSGIGGLLVTMAHIDSPYRNLVFLWAVLLYGTIGIRLWLVKRCRTRVNTSGYASHEKIRYAITTSLSGIAWGLSGFFILKASPLAMVVTITAIQAMTMGAALTLGAFLPAFLAFTLPAILPVIGVLVYGGGTSNYVLAIYSATFTLLVIGIAKRLNNTLRQVWQLTFEKEDLVIEVSKAHDRRCPARS
jgi:hypothetical protein